MLIGEGEEEGGVFVEGWFDRNPGRAAPLSEIRFSDGSVLSAEEIEAMNIDRSVVLGTSRDDTLGAWEAGEGNRTFIGGKGNDELKGGYGDDVYVWNRGDGDDVVYDPYGRNVIRFGGGIFPGNIQVRQDGETLVLYANVPGGGSVSIRDWFTQNEGMRFGEIRFEDGTVWDYDRVREKLLVAGGASEEDDLLLGTPGDDILDALGGNYQIGRASCRERV